MSLLGKRGNIYNNNSPPLKKIKQSTTQVDRISLSKHFITSLIIGGEIYSIDENNNVYCINKDLQNKNSSSLSSYKQLQLKNIRMISCGRNHVICLDYNGNTIAMYNKEFGYMGLGNGIIPQVPNTPIIVNNIPSIKYISCGGDFVICLSFENNLYSFGYNSKGQLGIGNTSSTLIPTLIPNLFNIDFIECGDQFVICKTINNLYYSWGNNDDGQLGQQNTINSSSPIQCLNWPDNIISIKCGFNFTILLTLDGLIYSFGSNTQGKIGLNNTIDKINIPTQIQSIPEIQRIECGLFNVMCIDIDNYLWLFGSNLYGQLGYNDSFLISNKPLKYKDIKVKDISSGGVSTIYKTFDNKIYKIGGQFPKTKEKQILLNNEDIWYTKHQKSKQKSARK